MKKLSLILVFLTLPVAVLILWPTRPKPLPEKLKSQPPSSVETKASITRQAMETSSNTSEAQSELRKLENEFQNIPTNLSLQERIEELAHRRGVTPNILTQEALITLSNAFYQEVNRPIDFYGRVVDDNDLTLQGAAVDLICAVYPENEFRTNILTDANGAFQLNTKGVALFINVTKEGYQDTGTNQNRFEYYSIPGFESVHPDPNNPVIFHLRKKETGQN